MGKGLQKLVCVIEWSIFIHWQMTHGYIVFA
jgi:hypothetical protein